MHLGEISRRFGLACAFAGGLAVVLGSAEARADKLADIKSRGTLVCGTVATTAPLGFRDPKTGEVVGFDIDICKAVAEKLGVKYEQVSLSLEARIPELEIGRVDILSALLGYTAERSKQIAFTDSHFQVPIRVIVPVNSPIKSMADLKGQKIGSTTSSTPSYWLRRNHPDAESVTFRDSPSTFLALQQRKIAGMGITETSGQRYINQAPGAFQYADGTLGWEPNALGVKNGEPALLSAVNDALRKLEAEGRIDQIWDKWFGPETEYKIKREKRLTTIEAVAEDMAKQN